MHLSMPKEIQKLTACPCFVRLAPRFPQELQRLATTTDFASIARIGIDESGKGDYFGPLVIAAVYVDSSTEADLALMQVRDSKKISDGRILQLAPDIRLVCRHSVVAIGPQRYNELYAKIKNLNRLLAWGHARALENMLQQVECSLAISDQFGDQRLIQNALQEKGKLIQLVQRTKAESDLAVAAASILARAEFLLRLQRLSHEVGTTLPKGASPAVELAARMIVKKHGRDRLEAVAKLHFKTTRSVLGEA
jgi:ribonuclease HIII